MNITTAPTITPAGISAPSPAEVIASLEEAYRGIFGSDIDVSESSKEGQLLRVFALAISDANAAAVAVYNAFSPATAQGAGLSSVVKINGLARKTPAASQALVRIVGVTGTTISSGIVQDIAGLKWDLPASVVIPTAGEVTVTATCRKLGDVSAPIGTITTILTPTLGWQSVSNTAAATPGAAVETDAALRRRQALSTAIPSTTLLSGLRGALSALPGVTSAEVLENDTGTADMNGLPAHSIACIVKGGDTAQIAQTIMLRKTPGTYTHGTIEKTLYSDSGIGSTIRYFPPTPAPVRVAVTLRALAGYNTATVNAIKQAVADHINGLPFGEDVVFTRLYGPALLIGAADAQRFQVVSLQSAKGAGTLGTADLVLAFSEQPTCSPADVTITVIA
ncbi:baseplate J/gp47 family protein [Sphaerotilus sp.]|uniref:baseplate J/gp47 family protein n=1 Tax=Sphaerotilus sp. TaxID=2093942 RepID=UPI00286DC966|nr:baseplate J/gp47 family protein [Sphaerotilus sp.]